MTYTSTELVEMLRQHHDGPPSKPSPGYFVSELQAPHSDRRADALFIPLTHHLRGQLIGHEIKVSRRDVVVELDDPTKADAWAKYCTQWWLTISDPDLVKGLEIPDHWGVMAPPSGRSKRLMTILKPAPKLKPSGIADALATIMSRMFYSGDDAFAKIKWLEQQSSRYYSEKVQLERQVSDLRRDLQLTGTSSKEVREAGQILSLVDRLGHGRDSQNRHGPTFARPAPEDVAMAIYDLAVLRQRTTQLVHNIRRQMSALSDALKMPNVANLMKATDLVDKALMEALDLHPELREEAEDGRAGD